MQKVYKKGRTSESTWGLVNQIRADVHFDENETHHFFKAIDVMPPPESPHDFGEAGDSGSLFSGRMANYAACSLPAATQRWVRGLENLTAWSSPSIESSGT